MTTLDGVERTLTAADLLDLRRGARPAGHRRDHGRRRGRGLRRDHRDPARVGVLRAERHRARRRSASVCAPRRARASSAASTRTTRAAARRGRWSCSRVVAEAVPAAGAIDVYPQPIERRRITVRTERVNQLLGTALSADDIAAYLTPLDIEVHGTEASAPTFRPDLEREIDLIEEVARRVGLDTIARTVPSNPEKVGGLSPQQRDRRIVADVLVGAGYDEVFTLPLLAPADLDRGRAPARGRDRGREPVAVRGVDPAPGAAARACCARSRTTPRTANPTSRCSRAAPCSRRRVEGEPLPDESRSARVRACASSPPRAARAEPARRRLRRHAAPSTALAQELRIADLQLEAATVDGFHPTRAARVLVDGQPIGAVGEVACRGCRRALARRPRGRLRDRRRRVARGRAGRPRRAPGVAFPGIVRRPRVRRRRSRSPRPRWRPRSLGRAGSCSRASRCSTSSAPTHSARDG